MVPVSATKVNGSASCPVIVPANSHQSFPIPGYRSEEAVCGAYQLLCQQRLLEQAFPFFHRCRFCSKLLGRWSDEPGWHVIFIHWRHAMPQCKPVNENEG